MAQIRTTVRLNETTKPWNPSSRPIIGTLGPLHTRLAARIAQLEGQLQQTNAVLDRAMQVVTAYSTLAKDLQEGGDLTAIVWTLLDEEKNETPSVGLTCCKHVG